MSAPATARCATRDYPTHGLPASIPPDNPYPLPPSDYPVFAPPPPSDPPDYLARPFTGDDMNSKRQWLLTQLRRAAWGCGMLCVAALLGMGALALSGALRHTALPWGWRLALILLVGVTVGWLVGWWVHRPGPDYPAARPQAQVPEMVYEPHPLDDLRLVGPWRAVAVPHPPHRPGLRRCRSQAAIFGQGVALQCELHDCRAVEAVFAGDALLDGSPLTPLHHVSRPFGRWVWQEGEASATWQPDDHVTGVLREPQPEPFSWDDWNRMHWLGPA